MSKQDKLIQKIKSRPTPKDFTWKELEALLGMFGYTLKKGKGSRRKFYKKEGDELISISLHEPHPQNEIKPVYIKMVVRHLEEHEGI